MEILQVTNGEYGEVINSPYLAFSTAAFSELNRDKCEEVYYLLFRDGKYRLGIIAGLSDNILSSPFSSPFGGFSYVTGDVRISYLEEAVQLLKKWAIDKGFSSLRVTLPPSFYSNSFIAKQINCLWRFGFEISDIEVNHSYYLSDFSDDYAEGIWYNARKNLRISLGNGLGFSLCASDSEKNDAYEVIRQNRLSRGKPLRMTLDQVLETSRLIRADFFLVRKEDQQPVASAIVFHVTGSIVQVIYWGDLQGNSELKAMNFLSFKVFEYYKKEGKDFVDLGYSTEHSVPNYGLSEFKESIGCKADPKYSFICKLQ